MDANVKGNFIENRGWAHGFSSISMILDQDLCQTRISQARMRNCAILYSAHSNIQLTPLEIHDLHGKCSGEKKRFELKISFSWFFGVLLRKILWIHRNSSEFIGKLIVHTQKSRKNNFQFKPFFSTTTFTMKIMYIQRYSLNVAVGGIKNRTISLKFGSCQSWAQIWNNLMDIPAESMVPASNFAKLPFTFASITFDLITLRTKAIYVG